MRTGDGTITVRTADLFVALIVLVAFGCGFAVAWGVYRLASTSPQVSSPSALQQPLAAPSQPDAAGLADIELVDVDIDIKGRPFRGPQDAPVTLVEFIDFQCPFCGYHAREVMPQLLSEYENTLKYVTINFPISAMHVYAQKSAEAAECARDQGKYWEYHDLLFENQDDLGLETLSEYAGDLGLDTKVFTRCVESGDHTMTIFENHQASLDYGVNATPTFFINGRKLVGAVPFHIFQAVIDQALTE